MNRFSQFNIKSPQKGFEGDKVKIERILNKEIIIHEYRIEESKIKAYRERGSEKCLYLQISVNDELHVVFTSSAALIDMISQVPQSGFPFMTVIIKENGRLKFT